MFRNKKGFIHYCCVSVNDGLNIDLSTSDLLLGKFDKKVFQDCCFCHCISEIKKTFTKNSYICDCCMKLLENQDQKFILFGQKIKNIEFFQTFIMIFLDCIFRHENIKNKCGKIDNETIERHINTHISHSLI